MQPDSFLESFDSTMWSHGGAEVLEKVPYLHKKFECAKDVPSITSFHSI